jgi:hypothetical protein
MECMLVMGFCLTMNHNTLETFVTRKIRATRIALGLQDKFTWETWMQNATGVMPRLCSHDVDDSSGG